MRTFHKAIIEVLILLLFASVCFCQQPLTNRQVEDAVTRGLSGKRHHIGLQLIDMQVALGSAMLSGPYGMGKATGFTIHVYTPEQWVELQAMTAKDDMRPFSVNDVTDEMRAPLLHVLALPSQAEYISGNGMQFAQGVKRIVLSDTNRQITIQPEESTSGTVTTSSAMRDMSYHSGEATFPMIAVTQIRQADSHGEFFIVVVGEKWNKFFKVKEHYLKQLGM
jgi:hypothetical protein